MKTSELIGRPLDMGLILMIILGIIGYAAFMYWICKDWTGD